MKTRLTALGKSRNFTDIMAKKLEKKDKKKAPAAKKKVAAKPAKKSAAKKPAAKAASAIKSAAHKKAPAKRPAAPAKKPAAPAKKPAHGHAAKKSPTVVRKPAAAASKAHPKPAVSHKAHAPAPKASAPPPAKAHAAKPAPAPAAKSTAAKKVKPVEEEIPETDPVDEVDADADITHAESAGEDEDGADEIVLTDAEGRRYCRVKDCDQLSTVDGYCRYHYLLYWKKIQVRKKILSEGKLERYIEELTSRYPDKFLDMLRKDLRSEKEFLSAIQELEIDESASDSEFEEETQTYIDEVRGIAEGGTTRDDEDF